MNIFAQQPIEPAFENNNNLIVLSADNNYAFYLGVCIESIAENCLASLNYDIVVLETNIHEYYKKQMISMLNKFHNISLRFYNLSCFSQYMNILESRTNAYFTAATYYRLYTPEIFYNYDRMLYLDCDLAVVSDFSELLRIPFEGKLLIAVPDITVQGLAFSPLEKVAWRCDDYLQEKLGIMDFSNYFQAGVLIFNLKGLRKMQFTKEALKKLNEIEKPRWVDQDILNSVLYKKVKYIDVKYNYTYHLEFKENNYQLEAIKKRFLPLYDQLIKLKKRLPVIIHYTSSKKPWKYPMLKYANLWWQYACMTPFYEKILYLNLENNIPTYMQQASRIVNQQIIQKIDWTIIRDIHNYWKIKLNYLRCRFLSHITLGRAKLHYKKKKKGLKSRIKQIRSFLRGK